MKTKIKVKTWVYRPDLAKVKPEYLIYKGRTEKDIKEDKRLIKLCLAIKQILIDY